VEKGLNHLIVPGNFGPLERKGLKIGSILGGSTTAP
jgi:hypothetical protein